MPYFKKLLIAGADCHHEVHEDIFYQFYSIKSWERDLSPTTMAICSPVNSNPVSYWDELGLLTSPKNKKGLEDIMHDRFKGCDAKGARKAFEDLIVNMFTGLFGAGKELWSKTIGKILKSKATNSIVDKMAKKIGIPPDTLEFVKATKDAVADPKGFVIGKAREQTMKKVEDRLIRGKK